MFVLWATGSFAQGETWNWCFGDSVGIKFINGKNPIAVTYFRDRSDEGTSIINDSNGKLLYYAFSNYLYDSTHTRLNNRFILKGGASNCQPIQLVKHRNSTPIHIFTTGTTPEVSTYGFNYSIFDKGFKVINSKLIKHIGEKQTHVFHQNNNDIWVSTHSLLNDTFYSFLVKEDGIIECPVINKIGAEYQDVFPTQGILKFSPSGKYCANANWNLNRLEIYKFDHENSKLTDLITIEQFYPYAVEFSFDENYLYFTDRGQNIYQVSLRKWSKDSIEKSKKTIASASGEDFFQMQLAPNGKMYVALAVSKYIACIEKPNAQWDSVNFIKNALYLGGRYCLGGFPDFNAGFFYTPSVDFSYEQDCRTNTIAFIGNDTFLATNHKWNISNGALSINSTGKTLNFVFPDTGKWHVRYISEKSNRKDSITKILTIRPKLEPHFLGKDINFCQINPTIRVPKGLHCVHWYNDSMTEIGSVDSIVLANEGTYYAKVTNLSFCVEWDSIKLSKSFPSQYLSIIRIKDTVKSVEKCLRYIWFLDGQKIVDSNEVLIVKKNGIYKLHAYTKYGCWIYSNEILVSDVSLNNLTLNDFITISPNPSRGNIKVTINSQGKYKMEVYNETGLLILEKVLHGNASNNIQINSSSSFYIVKIIDSEHKSIIKRILIE